MRDVVFNCFESIAPDGLQERRLYICNQSMRFDTMGGYVRFLPMLLEVTPTEQGG